ncbi:ADP-ribosylglycohydrolase family protein [Algoriphagus namhaensis]
MKNTLPFILLALLLSFCSEKKQKSALDFSEELVPGLSLTEEELYDKILGMMVGSAIGDAMGAPTEMWPRDQITRQYGFVQDLDSMIRPVSPEGVWLPNLPAGGTTDDTRWKILTAQFLQTQDQQVLDASDFAQHILQEYTGYVKELQALETTEPGPFETVQLKMGWLQEWAKVSKPYVQNDLPGYAEALGKFYGGEMVCAGLLYASALGAYFPGNPEKAYQEAFKLSIYDIGYAKDLTGLAAAMTAAGMKRGATADTLRATFRLDPQEYFQSRLVGRSAYVWIQEAQQIDYESRKIDSLGTRLSSDSKALNYAFAQLDARQQDMPFHAGEIFLQTLTAMYYADFDLMGTLTFLVNYGRDNDTTAALAGGILGAWIGFEALPEKEKKQVLSLAKELLGQDLEQEARQLTHHMIKK